MTQQTLFENEYFWCSKNEHWITQAMCENRRCRKCKQKLSARDKHKTIERRKNEHQIKNENNL